MAPFGVSQSTNTAIFFGALQHFYLCCALHLTPLCQCGSYLSPSPTNLLDFPCPITAPPSVSSISFCTFRSFPSHLLLFSILSRLGLLNKMQEIFVLEVLSLFTLFGFFLSILCVSKNSTSTLLRRLGSLNILFCELMALSRPGSL